MECVMLSRGKLGLLMGRAGSLRLIRSCFTKAVFVGMSSLCCAVLLSQPIVFADSKGKFPGVGSADAWVRAGKFKPEAVKSARQGDFETAIKYDKQAISEYPYDSTHWHNLACHLVGAKRYKEAIDAGKKAVQLEPGYANAWEKLGAAYGLVGQLDDALACFRKAYPKLPNCSWLNYNMGCVLALKGKYQDAQVYLKKAKASPDTDRPPAQDIENALSACEKHPAQKEASQ